MGEESGECSDQRYRKFKGKKGFGVAIEGRKANPGNTSIRKLFSEEKYHEAILGFLENTSVGRLKEAVLIGRS